MEEGKGKGKVLRIEGLGAVSEREKERVGLKEKAQDTRK